PGDPDIGKNGRGERPHVSEPWIIHLEPADDVRLAALQNFDNAAFGPLVSVPLDPSDHSVSVHRLDEVRGGDEDVPAIVSDGLLRDHESEPTNVRGQPSYNEIHLL